MSWPVAIRPPCESGIIRRTWKSRGLTALERALWKRSCRSHDSGWKRNAEVSAPAFLSRPEELELLCHSDQLGERSGLHLTHDLRAMKLDRDQGCPKF
jgi:hypothetical protein